MLFSVLALSFLLGCAHPTQTRDWSQYEGPGTEYFQQEELKFPDVTDPLEPFNRSIDAGNRFLLSYILDPLAMAWRAVTPDSFRASLVRAARNLGYPERLVNNLLQEASVPTPATLAHAILHHDVPIRVAYHVCATQSPDMIPR